MTVSLKWWNLPPDDRCQVVTWSLYGRQVIIIIVRPCQYNYSTPGSAGRRQCPGCHKIFIVVISPVLSYSSVSSSPDQQFFLAVFRRGRNLLEQKIKRNLSFLSLDRETYFLLILELSYLIALPESFHWCVFSVFFYLTEGHFSVENVWTRILF